MDKEINPVKSLSKQGVRDLYDSGEGVVLNFNELLGDTIKERYESLYVKLARQSADIYRKTGLSGANFILASPEIASIFETCTVGFWPVSSDEFELDRVNHDAVIYCGTVNSRWRLYKSPTLSAGEFMIGIRDGDTIIDVLGSRRSFVMENFIV